jgi:hypothetical protein
VVRKVNCFRSKEIKVVIKKLHLRAAVRRRLDHGDVAVVMKKKMPCVENE